MNALDRYLTETQIGNSTFARLLQEIRRHDSQPSRDLVMKWRLGQRVPLHDSRRYIEIATKGAVPMEAWPPLVEARRRGRTDGRTREAKQARETTQQ